MCEITREMIRAGEEVLDHACAAAGLPLSSLVISAARDVYIAMSLAAAPDDELESVLEWWAWELDSDIE